MVGADSGCVWLINIKNCQFKSNVMVGTRAPKKIQLITPPSDFWLELFWTMFGEGGRRSRLKIFSMEEGSKFPKGFLITTPHLCH